MSRSPTRGRLCVAAVALCALVAGGCSSLPPSGIDPSGQRIFAAGPAGPAAPGSPPAQARERYRDEPGGQLAWDDVGLSLVPRTVVAPVGSEVVLRAGVRGRDNYLRTARRLEWAIAQGSVGQFVAVGDNGWGDYLAGDFTKRKKVDGTFAIGSTSLHSLRLHRGTTACDDDVYVLAGQGWASVASPIEGSTHVTVFAPDVFHWDQRVQSAVVHWVDALWQFPPPAINAAGTRRVLTTTVVRQSDRSPCVGWRVRYEVADGPPAGFAPDGAAAAEAPTDSAGQASAEIFQKQPGPGTNRINIQIVRPTDIPGAGGKPLVIGGGGTLQTWTAPSLSVRVTGPAVASLGSTLTYQIAVTNPGDQPTQDAAVTQDMPDGMTYVSSAPAAGVAGRQLAWRIGRLTANETRTLEATYRADKLGSVRCCASVTAGSALRASDCATTTIAAPTLELKVVGPTTAAVGSQAAYQILVTNRSQSPAERLTIRVRYDAGFEHEIKKSPIIKDLGTIAPGQSQSVTVSFRVAKAGRLCHTVEILGPEGLRASQPSCLTATDAGGAAPPAGPELGRPALTVTKTGPKEKAVGESAEFAIQVKNTGNQPLTNIKVLDQYDIGLKPQQATEGHRAEVSGLSWSIAKLAAGEVAEFDVVCSCETASSKTCNRVSVTSQEGAAASAEACLAIRPSAAGGPSGAAGETLAVSLLDMKDPIDAGEIETYEVLIANQGREIDRMVTLVVETPVGTTPSPMGTGTLGPKHARVNISRQTVRFEPVPEVKPGESLRYRIRVQTRQPGQMKIRAEATSLNQPRPVVREETTDVKAR